MPPMKFPRRLPVRPHVEAIEREDYVQPATIEPPALYGTTSIVLALVTIIDDHDDGFPAFMLDGRPPAPTRADIERPVAIHTRKL